MKKNFMKINSIQILMKVLIKIIIILKNLLQQLQKKIIIIQIKKIKYFFIKKII